MEIKSLNVECSKSKKIPGFEFSSQRFGISVVYENVPYEFSPSDVEQHCTEIHSFLAEIIDSRLGLIYSKPKPENCQPIVIDSSRESVVRKDDNDPNGVVPENNKHSAETLTEEIDKGSHMIPPLASKKQLHYLKNLCKENDIEKSEVLEEIALAYGKGELSQLTIIECSELITSIKNNYAVNK